MTKIRIFALLAALACAGCVQMTGTRTIMSPDGQPQTLKITSTRFLWSSEGIAAHLTDEAGFIFTLEVKKSTPDQESIAILSAAVVDLAKMSAKAATNSAARTQ